MAGEAKRQYLERRKQEILEAREKEKAAKKQLWNENGAAVIYDLDAAMADYQNALNAYRTEYINRFENDGYRSDTIDALKGAQLRTAGLDVAEKKIRSITNEWGDFLNKDYLSSLDSYLSQTYKTNEDIMRGYINDVKYMKSFKDEKDYTDYWDYEERKNTANVEDELKTLEEMGLR